MRLIFEEKKQINMDLTNTFTHTHTHTSLLSTKSKCLFDFNWDDKKDKGKQQQKLTNIYESFLTAHIVYESFCKFIPKLRAINRTLFTTLMTKKTLCKKTYENFETKWKKINKSNVMNTFSARIQIDSMCVAWRSLLHIRK